MEKVRKKWKKELKRIFVLVMSIALIGSSIDISTVTVSATEAAKSQETQPQVTECEHDGEHTVTCGDVEKDAKAVEPENYDGSQVASADVSTLTTESTDADVAKTFNLYVNGMRVTDSSGAIEGYTLSDSNAGWSYAPATGTLTLTDATLTNGGGPYGAAIYWEGGDLTIELEGTNTIDIDWEYPIFFKEDTNDRTFTINGPGTLNVDGGIYHEYSTGEGRIVIAEGAVVNTSEISGLGSVSIIDSTVIADGSGWAGIYSEADVTITNSYVVAKSDDGSGIQAMGNLTIADSQVKVAGSKGDIASVDEMGFSNSIVTVGTETTVTGTATLKEGLNIASGESINFEEGASITNLEKLTVEEGATVEANGVAHTHNTDGAVTYIQADKSNHVKKVACKDCFLGYSIESSEAHSFENNTCIYCGITKVDLRDVTLSPWTSVDGGKMESEISGELGGAINTLGVSYDTAGTTIFDEGEQLKIINAKSTNENQGIYTYDGGLWKSGNDTYVSWNTEGENQFQAIYPSTADYAEFLLPDDQSTMDGLSLADWMTASTESMSKPDDNTLNLNFEHMLSKVTVKITQWGDEFSGGADVSDVKIYSKGTNLTVDNNGKIICEDNMVGISPYEEGNDTYTAIIAPGEYCATDKFVTMEVNGSVRTILAKASDLTEGLEAGKHYTFELSVGEDEVTIAGITVSDWETETIHMGGDIAGSMPVNTNISNGKLTGDVGVNVTSLLYSHYEKFHNSNVKFSYDADAGWRTDSPIYYEGYPSVQTISAYAPYNENGAIDIMLPEVQTEDTFVYSDYLWTPESSLKSDTVSLTMQHLLSAVSIGVSDRNSLTDDETIYDVRLEGMVNGASFDAATGLNTTNVVTDQTFSMYQSGDGIYQALVIPYEYDTFTVKVVMSNGDIYEGVAQCPEGKVESGKVYNINLALTECEKTDYEGYRFVWSENAGKWVCAEETQHVGGTATCSNQAKCELCGEAYGELDAGAHEDIIYAVTDNTVRTSTIAGSCSGCKKSLGSITLNAPDGDSLIYNGVVKGAYLDGSIDGVDDPAITYNTDDNAPVNAGDYTASITLGEGENAVTASVPFTIEKAELKVIGANAKGKVYDATNVVEITDVVIKGIFIPDEVYVPVSGLFGTVSSANVGNYMEVTLPELSLAGAAAANYTLVQPTDAFAVDLNITKAAAPTVDVIDKKYLYSRENTGTIQLTTLLPADCGAVTYGVQTSGELQYAGSVGVSNGVLNYTLAPGAVNAQGAVTVTATTDNYEDITITVNITLTEQIPVELQEGTEVTLQNNTLTYGEPLSKLAFNNAVFVDDDGNVVAGTLAWKEPMATPNAVTTSATWVFTPDDSDYASVEGTAAIVVNKAAPDVSVLPTVAERVYNPEKSLADSNMTGGTVLGVDGVDLEGIWNWENTAIIPDTNNSGYTAVFTPVDTANYEVITKTIAVPVTKATPFIVQNPEAESVSYGDALSASQLIGGAAIYGNGAGEAGEEDDLGISMVIGVSQRTVAGSFAWKDGKIKPTVADSNTTPYTVVFTPNDTVNYNTVEFTLTLTVGKAVAPFVQPAKTMTVPYHFKTVGAVTLPVGWTWQESYKTTALTVGTPITAKAVYTAADKDNFETTEATVTITRAACGHVWNSGVITTKPTATKTGVKTYTCTDCGVTRTETVAALGAPKKGTTLKDSKNKAYYKVTKAGLKNGTVEYVKPVNKKATTVSIPATIKVDGITYKVTSVAKNAFKSNKKVTKVTIGSNVKTIGASAFYGCTKLKTLTIGKNVTTIGDKAFYKCTALTKVTIPSKVTKLGKSAFYGCKKLKTVTIKTTKLNNSRVGSNAFKGIYSKAVIKVPKAKVKAYTTLLQKKGIGKAVTVKKY